MTYYSEADRSPQTFRVRGQKLPARVKAGIILWLRIIHEQVLTADGLIGLRGEKTMAGSHRAFATAPQEHIGSYTTVVG